MINMAVFSLKDIIKYLIKITIIITIVIGLMRYFYTAKDNISKQAQAIEGAPLISCLDTTIPGIASLNKEETEKVQVNPLKKVLEMQLGMLTSIKDKKVEADNAEKSEQQTDEEKAENEVPEEPIQTAETNVKTEVQSSSVKESYNSEYNGVKIKNETDYKLTKEILTPDIDINTEDILIFHTHTCESYTESEKYEYKQTGNYRTTDRDYSVVNVGRELDRQLENYGYNVVHDETYHDYPSYSGSYSNSYKTVTNLLEKNKDTDIVIDLHRDAVGDNTYAPTVKIGDEYAAQLMFVMGGNISKEHPNWQQNLKFAIKVQEKANEMYPGLFRPIILRYASYNQQTAKAACIIEVGATGNTMDQALTSMKYLAKVLSEAL